MKHYKQKSNLTAEWVYACLTVLFLMVAVNFPTSGQHQFKMDFPAVEEHCQLVAVMSHYAGLPTTNRHKRRTKLANTVAAAVLCAHVFRPFRLCGEQFLILCLCSTILLSPIFLEKPRKTQHWLNLTCRNPWPLVWLKSHENTMSHTNNILNQFCWAFVRTCSNKVSILTENYNGGDMINRSVTCLS